MATYRVQQQRWAHWPKVLIVEQYTTLENYEIGVAYGRYVPERRVTELEAENAKLRDALATCVRVQRYLCADKDRPWCDEECALRRHDTDDCVACDAIALAEELGIEVD